MAIIVNTQQPQLLLENIKKDINDKKIQTWAYDDEGNFYHIPNQWEYKGWLSPKIEENRLIFGIVGSKSISMSIIAYAVYHARFTEMLLAHFDQQFTDISITSQKTGYDIF